MSWDARGTTVRHQCATDTVVHLACWRSLCHFGQNWSTPQVVQQTVQETMQPPTTARSRFHDIVCPGLPAVLATPVQRSRRLGSRSETKGSIWTSKFQSHQQHDPRRADQPGLSSVSLDSLLGELLPSLPAPAFCQRAIFTCNEPSVREKGQRRPLPLLSARL